MQKSIIAGCVVGGLGLLSMGLLGGALAYLVWPVTWGLAGNPNDWRGDDVWPAMIGAGVLWGLSFPLAGYVDRRLSRAGWSVGSRRLVYGLVLWGGAALIWAFMIGTLEFA
ncbi:hypothetical protein [Aurantiacibacter xanthus]|nr:hypothetical protein [Aurantiacibacter xanthus]